MRTIGSVKWFSTAKGFGFITPDNSALPDAFVHHSEINKGDPGFKNLNQGDVVEFDHVSGPKGARAEKIIVLEEAPVSQDRRSALPSSSRR
jgi:CspA family cold shock protein